MDLIEAAEQIINGQMQLVDFENETICFVNADTDFKIIKHYYEGMFYGYNLYTREGYKLILLETYNRLRKAERVLSSIKAGLAFGTTFYKLPSN